MDLQRRRGREGDQQQNKRVQTWAGWDIFIEVFRLLLKMRRLYKLRHVKFLFVFKLTGMRHNWLASLSNYVDS